MAIGNQDVAAAQNGLTRTATTENEFQTSMDQMIDQVDRSVNQITITGAMTGNATLAPGTTDNELTVDVTANAVGMDNPGIPVNAIAPGDLVNLTVNGTPVGRLFVPAT